MSEREFRGLRWTMQTVRDRCEEVGDCLLWKQGLNGQGYPQASIEGKGGQMVRRWVYENVCCKRLRKGFVVASTCDSIICCEPEHLISVSYGERLRRTYAGGTRNTDAEYQKRQRRWIEANGSKLTLAIAREIRADTTRSNAELARCHGVHPKTIYDARRGDSWREPARGGSVFDLAATGSLLQERKAA